MPEGLPKADSDSPRSAKIILQELLDTLTVFSSSFNEVDRRIETLPDPLSATFTMALRHAEELRHGTDHLIQALGRPEDQAFVAAQLQDASGHLKNLEPDLFMHVNGFLLRYCADALANDGLLGKGRTEEEQLSQLMKEYGEARLLRTGDRAGALDKLKSVLNGVLDLAPRVLAETENKQRSDDQEISRLQSFSVGETKALWASVAIFALGLLVWMW